MAYISISFKATSVVITTTDSGCAVTGSCGYVNVYDKTVGVNAGQEIMHYGVPREVPYSKEITGLVVNRGYRASLFAWQGAVIGYVDFVYSPSCSPVWVCETPLNGYEKDGCGNRRENVQCKPDATCIPGATRQVKCSESDTIITQTCVGGIWQTSDVEKAKCGGMDNIMTWMVAIVIVVVLGFIFGKGK